MAKAKDKRAKGARRSVTNPTSGAAQAKAAENRVKAVQLRNRGASFPMIAQALGVALSTAHGYVQDALDELRELQSEGARNLKVESDLMIDRGVSKLEALEDQRHALYCKKCKKKVVCKCGEPVEVPRLKPEGIVRSREAILRHGESRRRLHGIDADRTVIVRRERDEALSELLAAVRQHKPKDGEDENKNVDIANAFADVLDEIAKEGT